MVDGPSRVALVCGGVRGLGLSAARALKARGVRVHVTWRSSADAARALEPEFAGRIHRADLTDPDQAAALVSAVLARDGALDGLIHSVGDYRSGPLEHLDGPGLMELWSSNVLTAFHAIGAARSALRQSSGRVVLFGTAGLGGLSAKRVAAGYASAKSALLVLARSLALEEAPHGVSVNMLSPGLVPHGDAHPETLDPEHWARLPRRAPTPLEDVGRAVSWLLLDAPGDLTGADLPLSGAWML